MGIIHYWESRHQAGHVGEILAGFMFLSIGMVICGSLHQVRLKNAREQLQHEKAELSKEKEKIQYLTGIIPICSCCKRIRNDKGTWQKPETFIQDHCEIRFTHSICPVCKQELYPDFD